MNNEEEYQALLDQSGPEELDDRLTGSIYTNEVGWVILKHKFVIQVGYCEQLNKQTNVWRSF